MTDPIADMLTRIRNAQTMKHSDVLVPYSKIKFEFGKILKREGFVSDVKRVERDPQGIIKVILKYTESGEPVIKDMKKVSRAGRRVYKKKGELPEVLQKMGIAVVSTSKGLMTGQEAKEAGLGGEILCRVW
jgi:small subunit ribosomal protein S8